MLHIFVQTQSTHPSSGAIVRSPQPSFGRALVLSNAIEKMDSLSVHGTPVTHCYCPSNTKVHTSPPIFNSLVASSPTTAESGSGYSVVEGKLSLSSADPLSESSPRYGFPYICNSLPSAAATGQTAVLMPTITNLRRLTGTMTGCRFINDNSYPQIVSPYTDISNMEYRHSQPPAFHSSNQTYHARRLAYRPVVDYYERRAECSPDPLARWLFRLDKVGERSIVWLSSQQKL